MKILKIILISGLLSLISEVASAETLSDIIEKINELKTESSQLVKEIKNDFEIDSIEYLGTKLKYIDARSNNNGFIERLLWDLKSEKDINKLDAYNDSFNRLKDSSNILIDYIKEIYQNKLNNISQAKISDNKGNKNALTNESDSKKTENLNEQQIKTAFLKRTHEVVSITEKIAEIINNLANTGITIMREYRNISKDKKKEMIKKLESYRWNEF